MRLILPVVFLVVLATVILPTGCVIQTKSKMDRSQLIAKLRTEMLSNSSWLRIHAAEGLLDNGECAGGVANLFRGETPTAAAPYRIGVWRVLARSTTGGERARYVEQIREAMHDPLAIDRISAAESLGKINAASREDRELILNWVATADDATSAFPRWLLVLSSQTSERERDEAALAKLLCSSDPIARLRTAFALGRLKDISEDSLAALRQQLQIEPAESIARVYLITALLLHANRNPTLSGLVEQLLPYLKGKPNEQLEVGIVTGLLGNLQGAEYLKPLLESPEPDARIGAANGMLRLLK